MTGDDIHANPPESSTSKKKEKKKEKKLHLNKILHASGIWLVALVGFGGVAALLMWLAGAFSPKVEVTERPVNRLRGQSDLVVTVAKTLRPRFESAVGSIEPIHESAIAAKILARVIEVNVAAGQSVRKEEVLVRLDDEALQSRLRQAEAALEVARANSDKALSDFERAEKLLRTNAVSKAEFDAAKNARQASEASERQAAFAIEEAKVLLDYATIKSPFDGIVVDKKVNVGDTVIPGQVLLNLYDPSRMQLVANVRESLAMQLQVGQVVQARLESLNLDCSGTVSEIVPRTEAGSRSFQVKVTGPCPQGIYSGMFGRLLIPVADEEIIVVPRRALIRVGQLAMLDVVEDGQVRRRSVQLGQDLGEDIQILAGLKAGEQIIVR